MAQTFLRGSQLTDGTVTLAKLVSGYTIPTANLVDGANFIKRDGSVTFTGAQNAGGFKITNGAAGTLATDFIILSQLQGALNGIAIRRARGVVVANNALTGALTADGITYVTGEITLLTANTTGSQNGPWVVNTGGSWTRPTDWSAASTQKSTSFIVEEGTTYKDTRWMVVSDNITVDTTAVVITQDSSGNTYIAGNGILLTGSTFSTKLGIGVEFDGSQNIQIKRDGNSLITAAAGIKISDGTPGQVMLGTTTTGAATFTSLTGDLTITGAGVTTVNNTAGTGFIKYSNFVSNENPTGAINSSNTTFTLAFTPQVNSLELFIDGQLMEPGAGNDYTILGTTITMLWTPITGSKMKAYYVK